MKKSFATAIIVASAVVFSGAALAQDAQSTDKAVPMEKAPEKIPQKNKKMSKTKHSSMKKSDKKM